MPMLLPLLMCQSLSIAVATYMELSSILDGVCMRDSAGHRA